MELIPVLVIGACGGLCCLVCGLAVGLFCRRSKEARDALKHPSLLPLTQMNDPECPTTPPCSNLGEDVPVPCFESVQSVGFTDSNTTLCCGRSEPIQ